MPLRTGVEPVDTPAGGPGGAVGKLEGVGGPEGGIGGPVRDGTSGPWWEGGPVGAGGCVNGDGCPVPQEGGPCEVPLGKGPDPEIGAGFTGFPWKVGRVDTA